MTPEEEADAWESEECDALTEPDTQLEDGETFLCRACREREDEGSDVEYCDACAGSGEGMADGTTCGACRGSGEGRAA